MKDSPIFSFNLILGKFVKPENIFFTSAGLGSVFESDVDLFSSKITDPVVLNWITHDIRIKPISTENIIKMIILPMIERRRITKDNIIPITLFLFRTWRKSEWARNSFDNKSWNKLLQLGFLTKSKAIVSPEETFISSFYNSRSRYSSLSSFIM